jgi:hypothetical protein
MSPRRFRLRLYTRIVRLLLSVLTRIDDWMLLRRYATGLVSAANTSRRERLRQLGIQ